MYYSASLTQSSVKSSLQISVYYTPMLSAVRRGQTNDRVAAFHFLPAERAIVRSDGCSMCAAMAPPTWAVRRARAKAPPAAALVGLGR